MAFLGSLPELAVYGLVGGILGLCAVLLGKALHIKAGTKASIILPVIVVGTTPTLVKDVVMPFAIEANANSKLPLKIDDATTLDKFAIKKGVYIYDYTLLDQSGNFDVTLIKAATLPQQCAYWKPRMKAGSPRAVEYGYTVDGQRLAYTISNSDCP